MAKREASHARPGVIQRLREAKGWGQQALAQRAVVSLKTINSVENGNAVQLSTVAKIAKALGVKPSALLEGHESEPTPISASTPEKGVRMPIEVQLKLAVPFEEYDETGLSELLRFLMTALHAKYPISIINVAPGSVVLTLEMSPDDLESLVYRFCAGTLNRLVVEDLIIPAQKALPGSLESYLPSQNFGYSTADGKALDFTVEYTRTGLHLHRLDMTVPPEDDDD